MQSICWAAMADRRGLEATYDRIGVGYGKVRRPDPRLAVMIAEALGDAETIVNVGAGAGSYEPSGRRVVAATPHHPTFEIPFDFIDGYQPAFWRRPEAYLDPRIRGASSTFAQLPEAVVERAMDRLRADLRSGAWRDRHRELLDTDRMDYGYRLLVAG